ncbi:MAG: hypothetical protein JW891_18140 [Candidatus Lokiarchaeota archaeon]|nr:hypothetical protein [Candidatus Lokiarchaeota archaeon]
MYRLLSWFLTVRQPLLCTYQRPRVDDPSMFVDEMSTVVLKEKKDQENMELLRF